MLHLGIEGGDRREIELTGDMDDAGTVVGPGGQYEVAFLHPSKCREMLPAGVQPYAAPVTAGYRPVMDTIMLTVPSDSRGSGVVSLVLGGLGSRLDLPVDRIDELALAATTVGESVSGTDLELEVDVLDDRIVLRIGPLEDGTGIDPAKLRVIEPLVDRVTAVHRAGREWLELDLRRGAAG